MYSDHLHAHSSYTTYHLSYLTLSSTKSTLPVQLYNKMQQTLVNALEAYQWSIAPIEGIKYSKNRRQIEQVKNNRSSPILDAQLSINSPNKLRISISQMSFSVPDCLLSIISPGISFLISVRICYNPILSLYHVYTSSTPSKSPYLPRTLHLVSDLYFPVCFSRLPFSIHPFPTFFLSSSHLPLLSIHLT